VQAVAHQSVGLGLVSRHVSFRRTGGRALWPCSGRARERPEPVRAALCGPGRARAASTMARQAPAGKAAPWRWSRPRGRWPREIKWGCWLGDPAATAEVSGRHTRAADCNKRGINLSS
jgi:hypothetical protein